MSLDVAIQSVAFYVLSCSTCAKISHRRKAKVQAKRERAEKEALETEQPGLYRHPSPFSTNPFWTEEIMMGPGPIKKKGDRGGSKNTSTRALNTAGPGSSFASNDAISTDTASTPTAVTEGSRISGEGWNLKRYQREDEALWGHGDAQGPGQRIMDAIAKAGSSAGRLIEARLGSRNGPIREENPESYYYARNPPVNDLHPPVVSTQPTHKDQTRWMLQPPPSAKIMEGKERVTRSRSASNASRKIDGTPLSRQVTERLMEAKIQRGETPESRPTSKTASRPNTSTPNLSFGQSHDRDRNLSSSSSESSDAGIRRKRRPPPISTSSRGSSSRGTVEHIPIPSDSIGTSASHDLPLRPQLPTILSSTNAVEQATSSKPEHNPLKDVSLNSALNVQSPSPSRRLSPQANAMPASIPSVESKNPGVSHKSLGVAPTTDEILSVS